MFMLSSVECIFVSKEIVGLGEHLQRLSDIARHAVQR